MHKVPEVSHNEQHQYPWSESRKNLRGAASQDFRKVGAKE